MQYDVFICHASEDKDDFVRPLACALKEQKINVWYDEFSMTIGDSLCEKIDYGLSQCRFCIVVLSENFFKKPWAKRELHGITFREMLEDTNIILPIWLRVTAKDVAQYSLPLADKLAILATNGVESLVQQLIERIKHDEHLPLIIAREELLSYGVQTPAISNEWWTNLLNYEKFLQSPNKEPSESDPYRYWIFPLPYASPKTAEEYGANIVSAALQRSWSMDAKQSRITVLVSPTEVLHFIRRWPVLIEYSRKYPHLLALYAPQLTIPGFADEFDDVFDKIMDRRNKIAYSSDWRRIHTAGKMKAACGDLVALRHPFWGGYHLSDISSRYFSTHYGDYRRPGCSQFTALIWLLSDNSSWLPAHIHIIFKKAIIETDGWVDSIPSGASKLLLLDSLLDSKNFSCSPYIKQALVEVIKKAQKVIGNQQPAFGLMLKFIDSKVIEHFQKRY